MAAFPRIPVVMYHSVGKVQPGWLWSDLTIDADLFERQIKLLDRHGYRALTLDELRDRQENEASGREREVVLTFDDGYLDNWVYAYPILKRLGWRGTIYVNPDFIDPGTEPRPTLEDVWDGRCSERDLVKCGFLNRAELRLLHESGVMAIESHSMSHTWYATSAEIIDFHRPGRDTPWLAWNTRPDRKFAYLCEEQARYVPWGFPIHAHGRSLGIRRYLPDESVAAIATQWVAGNGGEAVFSRTGWEQELRSVIDRHIERGRFETDAEMEERFRTEIFGAKQILSDIVGSEVRHFCWPGGAYCDASWPLAEEAGFATICVARKDRIRWTDSNPSLVRRIGSNDFLTFRGNRYATTDERFLLWGCETELGRAGAKWAMRLQKAWTSLRTPPVVRKD